MDAALPVVLLSLKVAVTCVLLSLGPGIAVAWLLARGRVPGAALLDGLVHLPLVLPPVVSGYGLLVLLAPSGPLGGLGLVGSWQGASIASAVVAFPLLVRAARLGFEAVDPGLEEVALVSGASPWRSFYTISLPLAAPGIAAGALLAFGRSLGEFGATITLSGLVRGETDTLPLAIWSALQRPDGQDSALTLAAVATGLAFATVLGRRARWTR